MVIRKVGVLSCGKVMGALYALLGLIFGAIVALISLAGAGLSSMASDESGMPGMFGAFLGAGAIIFLPILYGVCGFLGGLITALIYNLVAGAVGGIELDVQ